MKRKIAFIIILALALGLLTGCGASSSQPEPENVVKIGLFEPFTGENSVGGKQETLGVIYANSVQPTVEINGVTYKVELEVADNESSKEKAVVAAEKLISDGVSAVIGSHSSDESLVGSPIFEEAGIPVLGACCTNPAITVGNEHYFRICWLDTFQGSVLANFADEYLNVSKVYCLSELEDNYSAGLCGYFIADFVAKGGEVIYESFPQGTTDFTPYIRTAQREGAEAFFAPVSTEAIVWILAQAATEKLAMPFLAGDSWDSNVVAAAGKSVGSDIYLTTFFDESTDSELGKAFVEGYQEFVDMSKLTRDFNGGNDMVSAPAAMGYDAYFVLLEAMKNAGSTDPAAINEALWTTTYEGVTGEIAFDPDSGDAIRGDAYIKKADKTDGSWDFVTIQSLADSAVEKEETVVISTEE